MALEEEVFLGLAATCRELTVRSHRRAIRRKLSETGFGELATGGLLEQCGAVHFRLPADKLSVSNEIIVEFLR